MNRALRLGSRWPFRDRAEKTGTGSAGRRHAVRRPTDRRGKSRRMDSDLLGRLLDQHAAALTLYARQWCDTPEDVVQEAFLKLAGLRALAREPGRLALPGGPQRRHRRRQGRAAAESARDGRGQPGRALVRGRSAGAAGRDRSRPGRRRAEDRCPSRSARSSSPTSGAA